MKVKARNANSLSARCAGGVRTDVSLRVKKRPLCGRAKLRGLLSAKKSGILCETSEVSRKSPQVFTLHSTISRNQNKFFRKHAIIRNKVFTFALDKTQLSLIPAA